MAEEDTVRVLARDAEEFLWSREKARRAKTLANMMDDASDDTLPVPLAASVLATLGPMIGRLLGEELISGEPEPLLATFRPNRVLPQH